MYICVMTKKFHISLLFATIVTCLAAIYLQQYRFYSISADYQFIIDKMWIMKHLSNAGGPSLIIASAISQFFIYPWTGGVASAIVYAAIALLTSVILRRRGISESLMVAGIVPSVFLFLAMENSSYGFRGHVAFVLMMAIMALTDGWVKRCGLKAGVAIMMIITSVAYYLAGSVSVLIGIWIILCEIADKKLPIRGLSGIICWILGGWAALKSGTFTTWQEALTPLQYYNWPSSFFFPLYAWIGLIAGLGCAISMEKWLKNDKAKGIAATVLVIVTIASMVNMYRIVHNTKTYILRHEAYLAEHERWDDIIALHDNDRRPVFYISYLNLALAKKGILLKELAHYNQMDLGERIGWKPMSTDALMVCSDVYYHIGYLAEARRMTFNKNILTPGGINPQALLKLASINAAMGENKVAKKYIYEAHKAPLYSIARMPVTLTKAPENSRFIEIDGLKKDLKDIIEANPDNNIARQFYDAYEIIWNKYRSR